MFLIEKGKTPRVQCGLCAKLCAARLKRQQKYGMLCDLCIDALISETMQKYMALARSGVPKAERWVEMRNDDLVIKYFDKRWHRRLQTVRGLAGPRPGFSP